MNRILLAGATGYLGKHIARELIKRSYFVKAPARNPEKLKQDNIEIAEVLQAKITQPDSIKDCCKNIDVVISTVAKESECSDTRRNDERGQGFAKSVDCRHIQKADRNKG